MDGVRRWPTATATGTEQHGDLDEDEDDGSDELILATSTAVRPAWRPTSRTKDEVDSSELMSDKQHRSEHLQCTIRCQ